MELEFTAGGSGGEAELFIHLDVDGLAALLRAVEAAMTSGRGELSPAARTAAGALTGRRGRGAFDKVTVTFDAAGNSGHGIESGAWTIPDRNPANLELPSGQ